MVKKYIEFETPLAQQEAAVLSVRQRQSEVEGIFLQNVPTMIATYFSSALPNLIKIIDHHKMYNDQNVYELLGFAAKASVASNNYSIFTEVLNSVNGLIRDKKITIDQAKMTELLSSEISLPQEFTDKDLFVIPKRPFISVINCNLAHKDKSTSGPTQQFIKYAKEAAAILPGAGVEAPTYGKVSAVTSKSCVIS